MFRANPVHYNSCPKFIEVTVYSNKSNYSVTVAADVVGIFNAVSGNFKCKPNGSFR